MPNTDDPFALRELFAGGGAAWLPLLAPTIERTAGAAGFIGPHRDKSIVPVRELTFQALKPHPPAGWNVVVFGQNPYPRVASATGIAMFDHTLTEWRSPALDRVASVRTIIKAALMLKLGIPRETTTYALRALLAQHDVVPPPEWFGAMLTQGVLLLNAALTASSAGGLPIESHTAFWRPVIERIVDEILRAKSEGPKERAGVVFAWWGAHARAIRPLVDSIARKYPGVRVRHTDHYNPAAREEQFCMGTSPLGDINRALAAVSLPEIDWAPAKGWDKRADADHATAERMGDFIAKTRELHKLYLERLSAVGSESAETLPPIRGVMATPRVALPDALRDAAARLAGAESMGKGSLAFAQKLIAAGNQGPLGENQVAAVHLYTTASGFYRAVNAALRDKERAGIAAYFPYLRLLLSGLVRLEAFTGVLYRGVALDMRGQYPQGATVAWWGISSCTAQRAIAQGFLGATGPRTLFEVEVSTAVSIRRYSEFAGEDEFLLAPGTQLRVLDVKTSSSGLHTVHLREVPGERLVS